MKQTRRILSIFLVCALVLSLMGSALAVFAEEWTVEVPAEEPAAAPAVQVSAPAEEPPAELMEVTNIALNKTATACHSDSSQSGFPASQAVDGDNATYWATPWAHSNNAQEEGHRGWLQVDLGEDGATVDHFVVNFRSDQYSNDYTIATSSTGADGSWFTVYTLTGRTGATGGQTDTINASSLTTTTLRRYVRITFNTMVQPTKAISVFEFEIHGTMTAPGKLPNSTNLCCNPVDGVIPTATAKSFDSDAPAANAIDGSRGTYWSSNEYQQNMDQFITVDLGVVRHVDKVVTYWRAPSEETTAAVAGYKIYTSTDGNIWGDPVVTKSQSPAGNRLGSAAAAVTDTFTSVDARYIKLASNGYRDDVGNNRVMTLFELEAYGTNNDDIRASVTDVGNLCRPDDGVNVATALAGAAESGHAASYVVDGQEDTYWSTGWLDVFNNKLANSWISIDLGTERDVQQIATYWRSGSGQSAAFIRYSIYTSLTAPDYTNKSFGTRQLQRLQYTPADPQGPNRVNIDTLNAPVKARYVTIKVDEYRSEVPTADKFMSLWEVEMYSNQHYTTALLPGAALSDDTDLCRPGDHAVVVATASNYENASNRNQSAAAAIDGTTTNWWATDNDGVGTTPRWLKIDLGAERNMTHAEITWEKKNVTNYQIQVSATGEDNNADAWVTVATRTQAPEELTDSIQFDAEGLNQLEEDGANVVRARYIRLMVTGYGEAVENWYNVAVVHFKVFGVDNDAAPVAPVETPNGNLCRPEQSEGVTVTATADSAETANFPASKAIDGSRTDNNRWASAVGTATRWLKIDLGKMRSVSMVKLYWQHDSVTAYTLQVSPDDSEWTTVYTCSSRITNELNKTITFDPVNIRYIKVEATGHDNGGTAGWNNVSLWEVEAYRDEAALPATAERILERLGSAPLRVKTVIENEGTQDEETVKTVTWTTAAQAVVTQNSDAYDITFAANYEQLVGPDGSVYEPLVDTVAKFDISVVNKTNAADKAATDANAPISLTIPGMHEQEANKNPKPAVIPELMEWYSGSTESLTLADTAKIVYVGDLEGVANELKADIQDMLGFELTVVAYDENNEDTHPADGDITLSLSAEAAEYGYDDETYMMEIGDDFLIGGAHPTGVYWGTRSLLQMFKLSEDGKSAPKGEVKDYPEFRLRGFLLDVGRKPASMDILRQYVKNMAWYKLNDFHIHLNDNLIWIEDYGFNGTAANQTQENYENGNKAYSAFRLESDYDKSVEKEVGALPLAAKDYHYSKTEFQSFVQQSAALGVTIVPEIDVPAHAKAITDAFPSLRDYGFNNHALNDHLNLAQHFDESVELVENIFDDYIASDSNGDYDAANSTFGSGVVHFGADEYYPSGTSYRKFVKAMITYMRGKGVTPRVWGSLNRLTSSDPDAQFDKEDTAGVQMDIWSTGWAQPQAMYDLGFDLINITDGPFYMVPNGGGGRGGYGDYLSHSAIYEKAPNQIGTTWLPASSSQVLGASFAIWNDNIDTHASGLDEYDVFARFFDILPIVAVRQWGVGNGVDRELAEVEADAAITGYAPQTNPSGLVKSAPGVNAYAAYNFSSTADGSGNGHTLTLHGAEVENKTLKLTGEASYADTGLDKVGWGNELSFWIKVDQPGVIFETDHLSDGRDQPYNEYNIKALATEDEDIWHLGFSRELYDYEFDADLPVGEWVQLKLVNTQQTTKLYVGDSTTAVNAVGSFLSKGEKSNTQFRGATNLSLSSFYFPVARLGSKTDAFTGYLDDVIVGSSADAIPDPVDSGEYDIDPATYTVSAGTANGRVGSEGPADLVKDGDAATLWHSDYSGSDPTWPDDFWLTVDLGEAKSISGYRYLPRSGGGENGKVKNFDLYVSSDNQTWTKVVDNGTFGSNDWQSVTFDVTTARYVKLQILSTHNGQHFGSAAEVRVTTPPSIATAEITFPEDSYPLVDGVAEPVPTVVLDGTPLTPGVDFTVAYENNEAEGTATATVTGAGTYSGSKTANFTVSGTQTAPVTSLENAEVVLEASSYVFTGDAKTPAVTSVTLDGDTLVPNKDYTVSYGENINVGTGTVTVTGRGDYSGSKTVTFAITPFTVTGAAYAEGAVTGTVADALAEGTQAVSIVAFYQDGALVKAVTQSVTLSGTAVSLAAAAPAQYDAWAAFLLAPGDTLVPMSAKIAPASAPSGGGSGGGASE